MLVTCTMHIQMARKENDHSVVYLKMHCVCVIVDRLMVVTCTTGPRVCWHLGFCKTLILRDKNFDKCSVRLRNYQIEKVNNFILFIIISSLLERSTDSGTKIDLNVGLVRI